MNKKLILSLIIGFVLIISSIAYFYINAKALARSDESLNTSNEVKKSVFASMLKPLVFEPTKLSISKIGLENVPIVPVGVEESGRLEVPGGYYEAGWYSGGSKAGETGNAILAGHYDNPSGGPAVFYNLVNLRKGDTVVVTDIVGKNWEFEVYSSEYVDVDDPEAVMKAYEQTTEPILTIITCGGVWDTVTQNYSKRLLIKAKKI